MKRLKAGGTMKTFYTSIIFVTIVTCLATFTVGCGELESENDSGNTTAAEAFETSPNGGSSGVNALAPGTEDCWEQVWAEYRTCCAFCQEWGQPYLIQRCEYDCAQERDRQWVYCSVPEFYEMFYPDVPGGGWSE